MRLAAAVLALLLAAYGGLCLGLRLDDAQLHALQKQTADLRTALSRRPNAACWATSPNIWCGVISSAGASTVSLQPSGPCWVMSVDKGKAKP